MKQYTFIVCMFTFIVSHAQITGIVLDAETKQPMEYVTVLCKDEGKATITNKEGRFALYLKDIKKEVSLSMIGYNTVTLQSSAKDTIWLEKAPIALTGVTVMPIEEIDKLLRSVRKRYRENHHVNKTICDVHLKQFDLSDGKYIKAIDMTGELEIPTAKEFKKIEKFRLSALAVDLYKDTTELNVSNYAQTILETFSVPYLMVEYLELSRKKYYFETTRIYQDNAFIYRIDFFRKEKKRERNQFSGTLFIDESTRAILEFRLNQDKSYFEGSIKYNGEKNNFKREDIEIKINYSKIDNEYLITYIIFCDKYLLNDISRTNNLVLSNTNFKKDNFTNQYPINNFTDLYQQLLDMNIGKIVKEQNGIVPTAEETEFFEKNK